MWVIDYTHSTRLVMRADAGQCWYEQVKPVPEYGAWYGEHLRRKTAERLLARGVIVLTRAGTPQALMDSYDLAPEWRKPRVV